MISSILFNKDFPFPHISFSLFLSCIIISIPILFNDILFAFLAANEGLAYPWQYLTSVFAHGPEPPLIIHFIINLLIIIFCVALTEKLIGTWRTFLLLVVASVVLTFIRFETYNFYNGISYFIFAYLPITFAIFIQLFKYHKKQFLSDTTSILSLFTIFTAIVLYPLYFSIIESIFCERNIIHLMSIILGLIFLVMWRKKIIINLKEMNQENVQKKKSNIWDKISRILGYSITTINLLALIVLFAFYY